MTSWIAVLLGLAIFWHFTDLSSANAFASTISPIGFGVYLIIALFKLFGGGGKGGSSGGGFWGGDSPGGWGGGGDCGGGGGDC